MCARLGGGRSRFSVSEVACMNLAQYLGPAFIVLALFFLGLAGRDYRSSKGKKSPARQAWLRSALIFGVVGVLIYLLQRWQR